MFSVCMWGGGGATISIEIRSTVGRELFVAGMS